MDRPSLPHASLAAIAAEKRVIAICLFIALSQFQYGFDSAGIAGFQSMPGLLAVFGYRDVFPSPLIGAVRLFTSLAVLRIPTGGHPAATGSRHANIIFEIYLRLTNMW